MSTEKKTGLADERHTPKNVIANASKQILLTAKEQQIFSTLLATVEWSEKTKGQTVIRVAGGWVRDKLLGKDSDDIDIAINNLKGVEFANLVNSYLSLQGERTHSIGVIEVNPEKSKHLETACFKVHGEMLDVNNLRTETYGDSRIPEVGLGTPLDDALRRDLTINAMFYNVNEDCIEDFCGTSIDDLKNGVIRTPLPPLKTFKDDPLRVIRAARFAGRYQFKMSDEIMEAACCPEVKEHLLQKVSRERYGAEINKILKGYGNPVQAFRILVDCGLFEAVFEYPSNCEKKEPFPFNLDLADSNSAGRAAIAVMARMHTFLQDRTQMRDYTKEDKRLMLLAAFLSPLWGYESGKKKKWMQRTVVYRIVRDSLQLPSRDCETVVQFLQGAYELIQLNNELSQETATKKQRLPDNPPPEQKEFHSDDSPVLMKQFPVHQDRLPDKYTIRVGRVFRDLVKSHWNQCFDMADIIQTHFNLPDTKPLRQWSMHSGLVGCHEWVPLLNGKELKHLLGIQGRQIGVWMAKQVDWQLLHPAGTKDQCIQWLSEQKSAA